MDKLLIGLFLNHKPHLSDSTQHLVAVWTRLELATPCVTGRYSNQLNYQTKFSIYPEASGQTPTTVGQSEKLLPYILRLLPCRIKRWQIYHSISFSQTIFLKNNNFYPNF